MRQSTTFIKEVIMRNHHKSVREVKYEEKIEKLNKIINDLVKENYEYKCRLSESTDTRNQPKQM